MNRLAVVKKALNYVSCARSSRLILSILLTFLSQGASAQDCVSLFRKYESSVNSASPIGGGRVLITFKKNNYSSAFDENQIKQSLKAQKELEVAVVENIAPVKIKRTFISDNIQTHVVQLEDWAMLEQADLQNNLGDSFCETIQSIEPDRIYRINSEPKDLTILNWGLKNIGQEGGLADIDVDAPDVWPVLPAVSSLTVAVIDSGVDYTHPDLAANIFINTNELLNGVDDDNNGYIDDISGMRFVSCEGEIFFGYCAGGWRAPSPDTMDDASHGSHVAGIISAARNNKGSIGVAPQVKILPIKFMSALGIGLLSDIIRSFDYVISLRQAGHNIRVINASFGGDGPCAGSLASAIATLNSVGVLVVAAAGNDSRNLDPGTVQTSPAECPGVIAVAALNNDGTLASFSAYGSTAVHVAAPGVNIYSSMLRNLPPFRTYSNLSGTSMAAPMVAGVAALGFINNPLLTPTQMKDALVSSSKPIAALSGKVVSGGIVSATNLIASSMP
jgi:subtilisin family serine protease